ncbi:hypothetical protein QN277_016450 [Acacia crassicarpa]|uniref:Uncharacterized protein n=1 Tax=Acacia crassicarpa TaxID=499986 RepID=A0AAE1TAI8_9FABA|nr:hypothetical protein QN277_016450 [Acacia crassicarpa]
MGGKVNHSINVSGGGPYSFVLSNQNHHLIGSLLLTSGNPPVYTQLYIYNTDNEKITNKCFTLFPLLFNRDVGVEHMDPEIVEMLKACLDKHNYVVRNYRKAAT